MAKEWAIFEFTLGNGKGVLAEWVKQERISKEALVKLDVKLDLLRKHGPDCPAEILSSGPIGHTQHIYKIKVKGKVQLRPLLCKGPFWPNDEFTFLNGAIERNNVLPRPEIDKAERHRQVLLSDRNRRIEYVRVSR